jgi:hypothetical protein
MRVLAECGQEQFDAGEPCSVEVAVRADADLVPQDRIAFQFPNSWLLKSGPSHTRELQCDAPEAEHYIAVEAPGNRTVRFSLAITPRHVNYPEGQVRHGRLITAELVSGTVPAGSPVRLRYANTIAPYVTETETLWLRVNGCAPETPPTFHVRADTHDRFRILVPSYARPGERFDVLIVSLDRFDNASRTAFADETLTLADGAVVAEHLDLSGSIRVTTNLDKPGVYRFRFRDAVSNAIQVADTAPRLYWGDMHIHTKLSHDGQGTDPYGYARNVSGLDFAAVTDHWESLGPEGYRILADWAEQANRPGTFVALPGDERNPPELTGHHNVYFRDTDAMHGHAALAKDGDSHAANRFAVLADADPSRVMVIPHHTGIAFGDLPRKGTGSAVDWNAADDRGLRPVIEIYSHHGQSEQYAPQHLLAYESNRMHNPERRSNTSVPGPYYAQDYWIAGNRTGVIASSDEHSGQGGRAHGGIAAVLAERLTRESIFDALLARQCYATTGERILLEFTVDDLAMGASGTKHAGDELTVTLKAWGTDTLLRVDILRYRTGLDSTFVPVVSTAPRPEGMETAITFSDIARTDCIYYARVVQAPLAWPGMAWSSPIWIDVLN